MAIISPATLLSFASTCLIIELTPGPNMAYLAILSIGNGRRAGFAAIAGVAFGLFIVGIAAAYGVSALISGSPVAYELLRWLGVLYLLWLAWDGWSTENETSAGKAGEKLENAKYFSRGLVTNILNPKAALFYVAILPDFIDASIRIPAQAITLTTIYVAIATSVHSVIVILAGSARGFLEDPVRNKRFRRVLSLLLAAIALWFGWTTSRGRP